MVDPLGLDHDSQAQQAVRLKPVHRCLVDWGRGPLVANPPSMMVKNVLFPWVPPYFLRTGDYVSATFLPMTWFKNFIFAGHKPNIYIYIFFMGKTINTINFFNAVCTLLFCLGIQLTIQNQTKRFSHGLGTLPESDLKPWEEIQHSQDLNI